MTDDKSATRRGVGVDLVKLKVAQELGWTLREEPRADLGLDGEIEVGEPDGSARGRLLSLHIERGPSFFRSESNRGFRYRPSPQHLNHWLSHATPVVLVLVDDITGQCYWQHVIDKTTGANPRPRGSGRPAEASNSGCRSRPVSQITWRAHVAHHLAQDIAGGPSIAE